MPLDIAQSQPDATALAVRAGGLNLASRRDRQARRSSGDPEAEVQYLSVDKLRKQYLDYLTGKIDEIEEQKESRRYYHGAQYTSDQLKILRDRGQPPLTFNRTSRKINCIVGLIQRKRGDPKALPNLPGADSGAQIATQSIRSVLGGSDWVTKDEECLRQAGYDGIAGVELKPYRDAKGKMNLKLMEVLADEFFYDRVSVRYDFSDARYMGIAKWLDVEAAIELFPDKEQELRDLIENGSDLTTLADREYKWISSEAKRVRLVEHWYKHKGQWKYCFYVATTVLDEGMSPFFDEEGNTVSRFVMFSCAVDQDGDRYSFVRNLKGAQDSLNQSKSKALHVANSRRVISEKGAVDDVETARREWVRSDGWIEVNPGFGEKIKPDETQQDLAAFMKFAEDASAEIDQAYNVNIANLQGVTNVGQLSGRAIELLREPGMAELGPFVISYRGWKLRVYRAVWNFVQRYWTEERWIRISGQDESLAQFIQVNGLELDEWGRPAIVNAVGELDVEVALDEGPDVASVMQETSDMLAKYPAGTFPPAVVVEGSQLPRSEKNRLMQLMNPPPPPPDPVAEVAKKLSVEQIAATNAALNAEAAKKHADAAKITADIDKVGAETAKTSAQIGDIDASAQLKRAQIPAQAARAAKDAADANLAPAKFALDAMTQGREEKGNDGVTKKPALDLTRLPIPPVMQPQQGQLPF